MYYHNTLFYLFMLPTGVIPKDIQYWYMQFNNVSLYMFIDALFLLYLQVHII